MSRRIGLEAEYQVPCLYVCADLATSQETKSIIVLIGTGHRDKIIAFDQALAIDPNNADALAGGAFTYFVDYYYGWRPGASDYDSKVLDHLPIAEAERLAQEWFSSRSDDFTPKSRRFIVGRAALFRLPKMMLIMTPPYLAASGEVMSTTRVDGAPPKMMLIKLGSASRRACPTVPTAGLLLFYCCFYPNQAC